MKVRRGFIPYFFGIPVGILLGVGLFTFGYARGYAYMTDSPAACLNCHVMRTQFDGWQKSSHRSVAVCNDCHTPPGFFPKYLTKALNGFHHSLAFTTGRFPDEILISGRNKTVTEGSCLKCHEAITSDIRTSHRAGDNSVSCTSCHRNVGHLH